MIKLTSFVNCKGKGKVKSKTLLVISNINLRLKELLIIM